MVPARCTSQSWAARPLVRFSGSSTSSCPILTGRGQFTRQLVVTEAPVREIPKPWRGMAASVDRRVDRRPPARSTTSGERRPPTTRILKHIAGHRHHGALQRFTAPAGEPRGPYIEEFLRTSGRRAEDSRERSGSVSTHRRSARSPPRRLTPIDRGRGRRRSVC